MNRDHVAWLIALALWGLGAWVIYELWYTRVFVNDVAEQLFGVVLYLVAFFYIFALPVLKMLASAWMAPEDIAWVPPEYRGDLSEQADPPERVDQSR